MPCNDVTEVLSITLDPDDRIIHYSLIKETCGGAVGNSSLLRKWVENRSASDVLKAQPEDIMAAIPTRSTTWEFLTLKHLFALQTGLQAFLGEQSASLNDSCVVDTVETTPKGIQFIALIKVDVLTEKIESCGGCGSCGTK
jgi:NifU-like protein involved in Fe-S cluster formation